MADCNSKIKRKVWGSLLSTTVYRPYWIFFYWNNTNFLVLFEPLSHLFHDKQVASSHFNSVIGKHVRFWYARLLEWIRVFERQNQLALASINYSLFVIQLIFACNYQWSSSNSKIFCILWTGYIKFEIHVLHMYFSLEEASYCRNRRYRTAIAYIKQWCNLRSNC